MQAIRRRRMFGRWESPPTLCFLARCHTFQRPETTGRQSVLGFQRRATSQVLVLRIWCGRRMTPSILSAFFSNGVQIEEFPHRMLCTTRFPKQALHRVARPWMRIGRIISVRAPSRTRHVQGLIVIGCRLVRLTAVLNNQNQASPCKRSPVFDFSLMHSDECSGQAFPQCSASLSCKAIVTNRDN